MTAQCLSFPSCNKCPSTPGKVFFHSHLIGQDKVGQLLMRLEQHLEALEDVTVLFLRDITNCKEEENKQEEEGRGLLKVEIDSDVENFSGNEVEDFESEDIKDSEDFEVLKDKKIETTDPETEGEGNFPCDMCSYVASRRINLQQHTKLLHSGLAFTCEYCQEEFGNEIKLSRHILKDHDVDKLQCEHCDFETLKPRSLDAHKAAKHRDLGYRREKVNVEGRETCEECGKSFKNASTLWHHVQKFHLDNPTSSKKVSVSEKKERMCPVCNQTFTFTQSQLSTHKQKCEFEKTGELKYVCEMCGRGFGTVHQQCSHRAVCLGKTKAKSKKCPHENCDYVTRTKTELQNHVRQYHLNLPIEKNHICNHCGKAYNLLYQLKQHIKAIHLEIRPFVCPECGKTFARKDKLQDHIDLHKGLFKYKCPFCQKGLNNSGALCNHKRICPSNPERYASLNDARIARERLIPPKPVIPPPKMFF